MTRTDFLHKLGLGAAFVLTTPCLYSCSKDDNEAAPAPTDVDLTIDLTEDRASALQTPGAFIIVDKVVVARTIDGGYAAASLVCSHEATEAMTYDETTDEWFCTTHSARFARSSGNPNNTVTDNPLTIYRTALSMNDTMLRVFS